MGAISDPKITIVEGDGAFNNIKRRYGRNIKVEVRDGAGVLVPNVTVTFLAPAVGPSITFGPTGNKFETQTDANGVAATTQVIPNTYEGRFRIRVSVAGDEGVHSAFLAQSNTNAGGIEAPKTGGSGGKKALWISLIGGGAAAGVILAVSGGSSSNTVTSVPTNLNIGGVSVGGPR